MSYIGNQPQYTSFLTDTFSGNGSTTVFTLRVAPANSAAVIIGISGVLQSPNDYAVVGNILTFSSPPPTGTNNISVRYLSLPASNVVNSAYRSVTDITATAGQTTFSTGSYTPGFVEVFRNGVRLGTSNFTATSGVTVVLGNPANAGDLVTVVSFFVSSVINAIPGTAGAVTANLLDASQQGGAGAMVVPSGSTGQRPIGPVTGMTRFNVTDSTLEIFNGSAWTALNPGRLLAINTFTNDPGTETATFEQMTNGGTFTWTKPAGCTRVQVFCTGAGAGSASDDTSYRGWGGGAGGTAIGFFDVTGVSSVTVTTGTGSQGIRGADTTRPSQGGTSSFGSFCSATGGRGGGGAPGPYGGGRGGFATGGNVLNLPGGAAGGSHSADHENGGGRSYWHSTGGAHNNGTGQNDTDADRMRVKGRYGSGAGWAYGSQFANESWRSGGAGIVVVYCYS
jgi:hypothetical protein